MAQAAPVQIKVDLSLMRAHLYRVTILMTDALDNQKFSLPCWTPGSYLMREFAQHVVDLKAYENGQEIAVSKINKNTFQVINNSKNIELCYEVYGFDSSIRAAFIDDSQAFFNGSSLFLCPAGKENEKFNVLIQRPKDQSCLPWRVATGMPALDIDAEGFGSYTCESYEELIDYPFQISAMKRLNFVVSNTPHEIILVGDVRSFDEQRLIADLSAICHCQIKLFGGVAPFTSYLFIARFEEGGHGGLEHRNSTMLLATPYALPAPGLVEPDAQYRSFLSLCAHEYFHAWNVKRLMPKNFVDFDLNKECYTTMLWLFEGITSYYDDLSLIKAKVISAESYLDILAKNYGRLLRNNGRLVQSLAQASVDAWIKFYRPNENTKNATVSYYLKGSFVGLLMDLKIRLQNNHEKSLDDLMNLAFCSFGVEKKGVDEQEFLGLFKEFRVNDIEEFKDRYIYETCELPLAQWLSSFGVDIILTPDEQTIDDKTKVPAYWGLKWRFDDHHRAIINCVDKDGPAMRAGISPFDEIIAVNNIRLDPGNMADLLGGIKPHDAAHLVISRKKQLRYHEIILDTLPLSHCKLSFMREPSAAQKAARISWLGQ